MRNHFGHIILLTVALSLLSCTRQEASDVSARESHKIVHSLPNSSVSCFAEDDYGYMWLGTSRGVIRYDGDAYHHYLHDRNYEHSLPSNYICSMFKDSRGNLWVGTNSGVARLNEKDEFVPVEFDHSDYHSESVLAFAEDSKGRIFLTTGDMIEEYDPSSSRFDRRILFDNGKASRKFFFDSKDRLWYLSDGKIRWKNTVDSNKEYILDGAGSSVKDMILLANSVICAVNSDGLYIWSSELNVPLFKGKTPSLDGLDDIEALFPAIGTSFYILTRQNDVFIYDFSSDQIKKIDAPSETRSIYLDSKDNLWFGTEKNGFDVFGEGLVAEVFGYDITYAYKGVAIESLHKMNANEVLVNTNGQGLYLCDLKANHVSRLLVEKYTRLQPLAVYMDTKERIWVATSNRCHVFTAGTPVHVDDGRFVKAEIPLLQLHSFPIEKGMDILEDDLGNVWISTYSHYVYVLAEGRSEPQRIKLEVESGFMYIPEMSLTSEGKIRLLTFLYGLFEIDPHTFEITKSVDVREKVNFNFHPTCMMEDSQGRIWLGTISNGAFVYDPVKDSVIPIDEIDCERIYSFVEDTDGYIWASTANGLYCLRDKNEVIEFSDNDNVIEGELSTHSAMSLDNGKMLFGGSAGLFMVGAQDIDEDRCVNLSFDDLFIGGQMISPSENGIIEKSLRFLPEIQVSKSMGPLWFSFSSPSFGKRSPIDFWYRLEGYDKDWQKVFHEKMIQYSRLAEGKYTLVLEARDKISGEVLKSIALDIKVKSPVLSSKLMCGLVYPVMALILICVFLLNFIRARKNLNERKRIQREKENEQELNKMNVSFFTNMSHEFRTPLTLILGPVDEMAAELEDTQYNRGLVSTVKSSVNRMLKLVDQIMDFSKLETDALNLSLCECDAADLFRNLVSAFRYNCSQKGIRLEIMDNCDGRMILLDTDKFEKILNNLMSNAVKYTPGGSGASIKASLELVDSDHASSLFRAPINSVSPEFLLLSVTDTGSGIPEDMLEEVFERYRRLNLPGHEKEFGSGIGLYYARRLATLHHGLLEASQSPLGPGTCFRLLLPVDQHEYQGDIIVNGTPANIHEEPFRFSTPDTTNGSDRPVVMLVEDDVDLALYVSSLLGKYYDVRVKYSADDAANDLKFNSPDLIITDVMLPGEIDGLSLCRKIKGDIETCHIPVMILSAKSTIDDQIIGIETGADSYVVKPVVPAYLLTLIKTLLANREKLRTRIQETTDVSSISERELTPQDRAFLESLYDLMEKQLHASELNVDMVAESLKISRAKLYYKFKGLINETPNSFFKKYKLNRAAELIQSGKYTMSEVADMTGFSSLSYFSVSFKKQFGVKPSDYS